MFIQEIFYSYQGEGVFIGYPQIFIRLFGCNITCAYCDEPDTNKEPHTIDKVLQKIEPYKNNHVHSVAITGGEPLNQVEAVQSLVANIDYPIFLETNATLPKALETVVDDIDYFSVDFKPGHETPFFEFMDILKYKQNVYIKYVLQKNFAAKPLESMLKWVQKTNPNIPVILQPVTPFGKVTQRPTIDDIHRAYQLCTQYVSDTRVIPQSHKLIGIE